MHPRLPYHIVEDIADPFGIWPLSNALGGLARLIEEEDESLYSQYEDAAPKYRHIGLEQSLEAVTILLGAGFVAAQAMLARTFVAVRRIAEIDIVREAGGADLPWRKADLFSIAAHYRDGVWDIQGINALANYFKHSGEWPYDWSGLTSPLERETVSIVSRLGLTPGHPDNMFKGAGALGFGGPTGLSKLGPRVQVWREAIQGEIGTRLVRAGVLQPEPPTVAE